MGVQDTTTTGTGLCTSCQCSDALIRTRSLRPLRPASGRCPWRKCESLASILKTSADSRVHCCEVIGPSLCHHGTCVWPPPTWLKKPFRGRRHPVNVSVLLDPHFFDLLVFGAGSAQ